MSWVPSRHSFSTQSDTGNLTPSTFPHLESAFSLNLQNHHPEISRCCCPRHKSLCLLYVFCFICEFHASSITVIVHLGVTHPLLLKNNYIKLYVCVCVCVHVKMFSKLTCYPYRVYFQPLSQVGDLWLSSANGMWVLGISEKSMYCLLLSSFHSAGKWCWQVSFNH